MCKNSVSSLTIVVSIIHFGAKCKYTLECISPGFWSRSLSCHYTELKNKCFNKNVFLKIKNKCLNLAGLSYQAAINHNYYSRWWWMLRSSRILQRKMIFRCNMNAHRVNGKCIHRRFNLSENVWLFKVAWLHERTEIRTNPLDRHLY